MARSSVYSVVDSGMTCYGWTQTGEACALSLVMFSISLSGAALLWPLVPCWCIALFDLEDLRLVLILMASVLLRVVIFAVNSGCSTSLISLLAMLIQLSVGDPS